MRRWGARAIVFAFLHAATLGGGIPAAHAGNGQSKGPIIKAVRVNPAPVIDGKLNDHAWQVAPKCTDFFCPDLDRPASERTEAWICYDRQFVYAAFYCHDSQPEKIVCEQTKRGGTFEKDDTVSVCLDVAMKQQWDDDYRFTVNPIGTQSESIPGGSASKVEWRGDWQAATQRVEDGWVAEMAIPLQNLRYPPGQKDFGIYFTRHLARERERAYFPKFDKGWDRTMGATWTGLDLPRVQQPTILMPYSLSTFGSGSAKLSQGMDVKYAWTNGLTSTLSLKPDFQNIENQILDISFSYTERLVEERRPFFVEGQDFFPRRTLFAPQRITQAVDVGFKTFGQLGKTEVGFLTASAFGRRNDTVFNIVRNFSVNTSVGASVVRRSEPGLENVATGVSFNHQIPTSGGRYHFRANFYGTETNTIGHGRAMDAQVGKWGGSGQLYWRLRYQDISAAFNPMDGYVPENDLQGPDLELGMYRRLDKGTIEGFRWELDLNHFQRHDGSLFHRDFSFDADIDLRNGTGWDVGYFETERPPYHDRVFMFGRRWNRDSLYKAGRVGVSFGKRAGVDYRLLTFSQGIRLTEKFGVLVSSQMGRVPQTPGVAFNTQQHIVSLNYDLTNERGFGGRFVKGQDGTNFYLSYRQTMRKGMDAFIILGDPNGLSFEPRLAVKVVQVFGRQ